MMSQAVEQLTKQEIEQIQSALEAECARLEHDLADFADPSKKNKDDYNARFPTFGSKDDENAAEVAEFSDNLSLEQTLESELQDIRGTLQRIAKKTYGNCRYCGELIDKRRLIARPTSSSCVACKTKLQENRTA